MRYLRKRKVEGEEDGEVEREREGNEKEGKGMGKGKDLWDLDSVSHIVISMWGLADSHTIKQDLYCFSSHTVSFQSKDVRSLSLPLALFFVFAFYINEFDLFA